jgi:hypothetical protein
VWNFFKKFSLPSAAPVGPIYRTAAEKPLSAAYANGIVSLRGMDIPASIRILDIRGRMVSAGTAGNGRFGFTGYSSGVYQVLAEAEGKTFRVWFVVP